jgi:hypothetical protein
VLQRRLVCNNWSLFLQQERHRFIFLSFSPSWVLRRRTTKTFTFNSQKEKIEANPMFSAIIHEVELIITGLWNTKHVQWKIVRGAQPLLWCIWAHITRKVYFCIKLLQVHYFCRLIMNIGSCARLVLGCFPNYFRFSISKICTLLCDICDVSIEWPRKSALLPFLIFMHQGSWKYSV